MNEFAQDREYTYAEQVKSQLRPAWVVTSWALHSAAPLACATQQPDAQSAELKH